MNSLTLPVIDPSFQKLKRSGTWLHVTAALLIVTHALSHVHHQETPTVYIWCQLIIALDILILVTAGRNVLTQLPRVNLFFRLVEAFFFLGIALAMLTDGQWPLALIHFALSGVYGYLFYCERRLQSGELLSFHHTGVSVPGIPEARFFMWTNINHIDAHYDRIHIETSLDKNFLFDLPRNLNFEELEQIHEFCRHYLKTGQSL